MLSFLFLLIQFWSRIWVPVAVDFFTVSSTSTSLSFSSLPSHLSFEDDALLSANAMVIRLSDRMLLYEKQAEERVYPASLTKIMTVLVALDSSVDLGKRVKMDMGQYSTLLQQNASLTGLYPNEEVTVMDLLYGVLLPSGADAAVTLANVVAGSEEAYVTLMNEKAVELGMVDTHFDNVTGLHADTHYTTVRDLVILFETALKNPIFQKMIGSAHYQTTASSWHKNGLSLASTLFRYQQTYFMELDGLLGGKTGYTPEADLCLASWFRKHGQQYLMVTVQAPKVVNSYSPLVDVEMVLEHLP